MYTRPTCVHVGRPPGGGSIPPATWVLPDQLQCLAVAHKEECVTLLQLLRLGSSGAPEYGGVAAMSGYTRVSWGLPDNVPAAATVVPAAWAKLWLAGGRRQTSHGARD